MSRRATSSLLGFAVFLLLVALQYLAGTLHSAHSLATPPLTASAAYAIVPPQPVTLYTEPNDGVAPVLSRIAGASSSVDMVMYELADPEIESALVAAQARGVAVHVLLDNGLYGKGKKANDVAYDYLKAHDVPVEWTPSYLALTHQKTLIVDAKEALVMTYNLDPQYYATGRDFAVADADPHDVSAIESTFAADWQDTKVATLAGDDLVWSPGSEPTLLSMIQSAQKSLVIYNEEMEDPKIISALAAAAQRGVSVQVLMTDDRKWHDAFGTLTQAGVQVRTYATNAPLYIHAKVIIADGTQAFIGSENFSTASLDSNRELGLFVSTQTVLTQLAATFTHDWKSASPYGDAPVQ